MALYFNTNDPAKLWTEYKKLIKQGHVETWECDADGDLTHTPDQWFKKAWMRPSLHVECLKFNIIPPGGVTITKTIYGVYHGRLMESFLTHCDEMFRSVNSSALATDGDRGYRVAA